MADIADMAAVTLEELKVIRVAQSCSDKGLKRKLFELKKVEQSLEKVKETVRDYDTIRDKEDLFSSKKGDKVHLITGKDGDGGKGRGRSPFRGGSDRACKHSERKKGEKDRKPTRRSPSRSGTRICWNCQEEADNFASTCPSKAKPGKDTPFDRSMENSGSRGASQNRSRTNMIKSGYGSDTEEEDEEKDKNYSEEDLT